MKRDDPLDGRAEAAGRVGFPVIGVGASAGGGLALAQFLGGLPRDFAAALVVVTPLAVADDSRLSEVFAAAGALPVMVLTDGLRPRPGWVYVLPSGSDVVIRGGVFVLVPPGAAPVRHVIDRFFRSLALDQGANAVAVVLSGTHAPERVGEWFAAGADEVITGFFAPAEQRARLDAMLERIRSFSFIF